MTEPAESRERGVEHRPAVFFADGKVIRHDVAVFAAGFTDAPDAATSRLIWLFDDGWASENVEDDFIVSITFSESRNSVYSLGRNGLVRCSGGAGLPISFDDVCGNYKDIRIADAEDRGFMSKIRAIGDDVYACGWGSQIYRLGRNGWASFGLGLPSDTRLAFLDINGPASDNLYAVGMDGVIAHFNGKSWSIVDSGTNINLFSTTVLANGEMIVTGAEGMVIRGAGENWRQMTPPSVTGNLWDVVEFNGAIFAVSQSSPTGLLQCDADSWVPAHIGIPFKPTTHRLSSGHGQLWSVGEYHLLKFDGVRWEWVHCPENEPG